MELAKLDNSVYFSSNNFESRPMQIQSNAGLAKGLSLMRNGIYTDKIMAVVREYICNAIDEHNKYCSERPVDITLDSTGFRVRDYGKGLDKEMVFGVFGAFFESTKTRNEIGGFGLGSKSGHAYGDVFHIRSYYEGKCMAFSFVLSVNPTTGLEEANSYLTSTEESKLESGIEVWIPLLDVWHQSSFEEKIRKFAATCNFPLTLNGEALKPSIPVLALDNFKIYKGSTHDRSSIQMGPVIYKADFLNLSQYIGYSHYVVVELPINSFVVPPSRETISINADTPEKGVILNQQFKDLIYKHLESKEFVASPVDIFNICHHRTSQIQFDLTWLMPTILSEFLRNKFKSELDILEKFKFFSGSNIIFEFNGSKLRNTCKRRWDVAALSPKSKIVILDEISYGPMRHEQFEEEMANRVINDGFYFIKNSTFDLNTIPDSVKDLFIDLRGFVWKKAVRNKSSSSSGGSYDRSLIRAHLNGRCRRHTKERWKELIEEMGDGVVISGATHSLNSITFSTKKAEKFFLEELKIPTYIEWVNRNRKEILKEYKKSQEFQSVLNSTNKRIHDIIGRFYKITTKYSEHYHNLTDDEKGQVKVSPKLQKAINWVTTGTDPWAILSRTNNYNGLEYEDMNIVETNLKRILARMLNVKQKNKKTINV